MKVNDTLLIEATEKEIIPEPVREIPKKVLISEEKEISIPNINIENELEDIKNSVIDFENNTNIIENNNDLINTNIFDNINDNETYSTYYVYIVKEDDTIDKILDKYDIKELPSLLLFKEGKLLGKVEGYYEEKDKEELFSKIENLVK